MLPTSVNAPQRQPANGRDNRKASDKPRPKPERRVRVLEQPTPDTDGWGCIEIAITSGIRNPKTVTTAYLVRFIPSDFGNGALGFEVEKLADDLATVEKYHVHLSNNPADCSCDCMGHEAHGHCKHRAGIEALRRAGHLVHRSASSFAKNDPAGFAAHQDSLAAHFDAPETPADDAAE